MNNSLGELLPMVSLEELLSLNVWQVLKWPLLLLFLLYLAFAFIIVRQVGLMGRTLNGAFALPIKLVAWFHLLISLFVFVLALIIL